MEHRHTTFGRAALLKPRRRYECTRHDRFALFARIGAETARICEGLTDEQWEQPSTCAGWKVKHLVAHQASGTTYSFPRMVGYLARYRKPAAAGHHMALDMGNSLTRAEIMAEFRRGHGDKPANLFARISDVKHGVLDAAIHLQGLATFCWRRRRDSARAAGSPV